MLDNYLVSYGACEEVTGSMHLINLDLGQVGKERKQVKILLDCKVRGTLVDTCETGGDSTGTINVNTGAAIVTASCGVPVAKHGNYSITSKSGSADVLRELGVRIDLPPPEVESVIERVGIGFMLASVFHPSMKRVAQIRRDLGFRTVFNILGPLTNPAGAQAQVIGVFDSSLCEPMANVLKILGTRRAMVVHWSGMYEISNTGETSIAELNGGRVIKYTVSPEKLGIRRASAGDIVGGSPEENARDIVEVLKGKKGAKRDIIAINAGAVLLVGGKVPDMGSGIRMANQSIDSGTALDKLKEFVGAQASPGSLTGSFRERQMKVKICGIKTERDLDMALITGADAVGFITEVPVDSPRKISLPEASRLISKVPVFVASVLVIMPGNAEQAIHTVQTAGPTAVQIHNSLDIQELKKIKDAGIKLIKTIPVARDADAKNLMKQVRELQGIADAVLLDTALGGKTGGTGIPHNWEISSEIVLRSGIPVILAGGLSPENISDAVRRVRPYAVDTASGVETDGKKDEKKVAAFIRNARMYEI